MFLFVNKNTSIHYFANYISFITNIIKRLSLLIFRKRLVLFSYLFYNEYIIINKGGNNDTIYYWTYNFIMWRLFLF